jgi:hypothetical protein
MPARRKTPPRSPTLNEWLRLQRRLVLRTSEYFQGIGEIAAKGAFEPGEYIGKSAQLWSNVVGDVGDWLKPDSERALEPSRALIGWFGGSIVARSGSGRLDFSVPTELFPREDSVLVLSIDGLIRTFLPTSPGRPVLLLEPGVHLELEPREVTRGHPRSVRLRVFDVPDTIQAGERYAGLVWGTLKGGQDRNERFPVAALELDIK